ncbi:hypothetical protein ACFLUE_00145 [Chloroflexota bacterium]
MKVLKGLALSLLGILLFLSLSLFGIAFTLNSTVLNPDFTVAELDRLDISSVAGELISDQLAEQLPAEMAFIDQAVIDNIVADMEPWIKEQAGTAVRISYDYLLGKSENLSLAITTGPVLETLKSHLWAALSASPPPEFANLPPAVLEQQFNQLFTELAREIPATFEVDESLIPLDVMAQLVQARQYINYFQTGYKALIGLAALLIIGFILIHREVKGTTRGLGIIFLTYGAIEYGGILAARHLALPQLPLAEIPPSVQIWLPQFINNLARPLEILSIGCMAAGAVLLVASFVYKRSRASS